MRILKVIHGFPPDYMAGSEVYSFTLCRALQKMGHEVFVFTRIECELLKPYSTYEECLEGIKIMRINKPKQYSYVEKFYDSSIDEAFREYLKKINPDIVHFGHLCHLSLNLVEIAKSQGKKVVFTLHDFWLFCVKGQLINKENQRCSVSSVSKCVDCSPYNTNKSEVKKALDDLAHIREIVDVFITPSYTLRDYFLKQGVSASKIIYQKYGFDKECITYKKRHFKPDSKLRFGFMGRIIPTKGIEVLIKAFNELPREHLAIYGDKPSGKRFLETENIAFKGGYDNANINAILNMLDVLIVPSIWLENSPLVIQEAFLAGVIVVASDIGGMKELIREGEGFLFRAGDSKDLANCIQNITQNPTLLNHIKDNRHKVEDIKHEAHNLTLLYQSLLADTYTLESSHKKIDSKKLRRVTIDTNPDTCNLHCKMCDTHSIYNSGFVKTRPDMHLELLQKCLKDAKDAGVKEIIPTTMGEPMFYKHFDEIVEFCLQNPSIKLNLTSNASLLFGKKYDEYYIIHRLLKVLSDVKISFNSLDSIINESIMRGSDTKKILHNIERLCALRNRYAKNASITLQMTFMRSNMQSIIPLIEYGIKVGINRIKGHQLWITYTELENEAIYNDTDSIMQWNALVESLAPYCSHIRLENFEKLDVNIKKAKDSKQCPFLGKELWVNYKGDISVCCAPHKQRVELGDFGNIMQMSLASVLSSSMYRNLCDNYMQKEVCCQCLMRR
ncbi:glycosyltransferase [Helicobacter sp. MIT 05-5293]|uniref:glycosyltransferase n=1 Tax=Helicobacter sp. MIT 05-5293 TaxID=1548149 RepID=UPI00051CEDBB|nr:glycosyltransferase [Helicobacter sp. MIT 05-5293]TLD81034.1 glycosyltransferase [Helicobacter sp. MIT 05-5293]